MLIDGRLARRRQTGVATYVRELERALRSASTASAAPAPRPAREAEGDAGGRPPVDVRVVFGPPGLPRRSRLTSVGNLGLELLWLHLGLPLMALWRGAALVHTPMNWAPLWCPCPVVVTVQDLSFERLPHAYPGAFRLYARLFARLSARRARLVLVASRASAHDVTALYGVPPERIRLVPLGVRLPPPPPPADAEGSVGAGEREDLVLSVGVLDPRKRISALVEGHRRYYENAVATVATGATGATVAAGAAGATGATVAIGAIGAPAPACRLVVVGGGGGEEAAVRAAAGPGCELRGFVSAAELASLYQRAALLVYPSAYEGFGLPVLEAMAHGCPVLVARNSALPEVAGEAATYLDDPTPTGIAEALSTLLADRATLRARGEAGRARAAGFSWDAVARGTLAAYRAALR